MSEMLRAARSSILVCFTALLVLSGCPNPVVQEQVSTPQFSPAGSTYTSAQSVTISTATAGASIRYTTDGSTPTTTVGTLYTAPVSVGVSETVKAIAYETDWSDSAVATAAYTIAGTVVDPAFSPVAGSYASAQSVTISTTTPGAYIRYTTDGSTPTSTTGTFYMGPVSVNASQTISAFAFMNGWTDSGVETAAYTIAGTVAAPSFSPLAGSFTSAQTVTISSMTAGASIYYTTDGSTPTSSSTPYTVPVSVNVSTTLKAIATKSSLPDSTVTTATYTLRATAPTYNPPAGTYTDPQTVTISTTTPGASIRYTTDGVTPPTSTTGTLYTGPFTVGVNQTLKAIAYYTGWSDSTVAQAGFTIGWDVTTPAGTPLAVGWADATGSAAQFYRPYAMVGAGSNLYVADTMNNTIRKIFVSSGVVTTFAGTANVPPDSVNATGTAARFYHPIGIATDGTNLYVADSKNYTVRKIVISTGVVTTLAGTAGTTGYTDATGLAAVFYEPTGLTTDGTNLYVTDRNAIRQIVISTGVVTTLAGDPGIAGASGSTNATGTAARFNFPVGITTDGTSLYVADTSNHMIRKIVISSKVVTTLAGAASTSGSTDGTGVAAQFNAPFGVASDGTNVYVADSFNHTIRKIVISTGVVTTIAGNVGVIGSYNGRGSAARFNYPYGLTAYSAGVLYVTDTYNDTIRRVIP